MPATGPPRRTPRRRRRSAGSRRYRRTSPRRCAAPPPRPQFAPRGGRPSSPAGDGTPRTTRCAPADDAWNVPTAGRSVPTSAACVRPRRQRLVEMHDVGSRTPAALRASGATTAFPAVIGAIDPFDGKPRVGPTARDPGLRAAARRTVAITRRRPRRRAALRASPSTCAWTPPKTDSEYGQMSATRSASPSIGIHRHARSSLSVGASVGQFGCIMSHCSGAARISPRSVCASSCVTRCDIVAQPAESFDRERRDEPDAVPRSSAEVGRRREQRRAARNASTAGPAGHRRLLPEELDGDAVAGEVAVAHQAHHRSAAERARSTAGPASGPSATTSMPTARRGRDEPLEELGRLDRSRPRPSRREPRARRATRRRSPSCRGAGAPGSSPLPAGDAPLEVLEPLALRSGPRSTPRSRPGAGRSRASTAP